MADLPDCRLSSATHIPIVTRGLDFVGPFPIKGNGPFGILPALYLPRHKSCSYRNLCLFQYRDNASGKTAFHFFVRKSTTNLLRQRDNIHQTSKELKNGIVKLLTQNAFRDTFVLLRLDWLFIPLSSPQFGGSRDNLVKVFKNAFYRVIGS